MSAVEVLAQDFFRAALKSRGTTWNGSRPRAFLEAWANLPHATKQVFCDCAMQVNALPLDVGATQMMESQSQSQQRVLPFKARSDETSRVGDSQDVQVASQDPYLYMDTEIRNDSDTDVDAPVDTVSAPSSTAPGSPVLASVAQGALAWVPFKAPPTSPPGSIGSGAHSHGDQPRSQNPRFKSPPATPVRRPNHAGCMSDSPPDTQALDFLEQNWQAVLDDKGESECASPGVGHRMDPSSIMSQLMQSPIPMGGQKSSVWVVYGKLDGNVTSVNLFEDENEADRAAQMMATVDSSNRLSAVRAGFCSTDEAWAFMASLGMPVPQTAPAGMAWWGVGWKHRHRELGQCRMSAWRRGPRQV